MTKKGYDLLDSLKIILEGLAAVGIIGAFILPDFIAGVTKAQRMDRAAYPKEQRLKKIKWFLIFLLPGCAALAAAWFFFYR